MYNSKKRHIHAWLLAGVLAVSAVTGSSISADAAGIQQPGSQSSSSVSWSGATTITSSTTETGQTYSSTTSEQNALLVSGSGISVTLTNPTVTKTGNGSGGDNDNFYGTNSGITAKGGAALTITGAGITTKATGANGVHSYGGNGGTNGASGDGTTVNISDSTITTTGSNSGGIMTTGGGVTNATDLTVSTSGNSSAAIRSDRGGGTVTVNGGTYTTTGTGSPAVYSTAAITVKNADLISKASEGIVIEGQNSVSLSNSTLNADNEKLNGNSTTYKGIMIYQSMSGDAASGNASFTASGSEINNTKGSVFYVTNTTASISLTNTKITNSDSTGDLLEIAEGGWGTSGSNGGTVTLNASNQSLAGKITVGNSSSLTMNLKDGSTFTGKIAGSSNSADKGKGTVKVVIEDGSSWTLTGNTSIKSLKANSGTIKTNGYTLTVNGSKYDSSKDYNGTVSSGTTKPGRVAKLKATRTGKGRLRLTWSKASNASGYQIRYYYTRSSGKKVVKTKWIRSSSTRRTTLKNLRRHKRYTIQIRAYRKTSSGRKYSKWKTIRKYVK